MIYLIAGLCLLMIGGYFLLKFLRNVQPDDIEIMADLKELKASIAQYKGGFVAWDEGVSNNEFDQILEEGKTRTGKGVFLSPSGNPIFAYAFRNYIGPSKNSLAYILTLDHEYVFRTTTKGTEVSIDGEKKGLIRQNGIFYDVRNNEQAQIKRHGASSINTIFVGQKEVAKIALPDAIAKFEAVEITGIDMQPQELELLKTLSVFELVNGMGEQNRAL